MRVKIGVTVILSAVIMAVVLAFLNGNAPRAEAAEIRHLLETASSAINVPQPGQLVHYTYRTYSRMPPATLEPSDPYHLPYEQIWSPNETVESWVEITEDGMSVRWRTQLFDASGALSQDMLFEKGTETDYFPLEGAAHRFAGEVKAFRDNRIALIEDFLEQENLTHREGEGLDGEPVLSVYTESTVVEPDSSWLTKSVSEALLTFQRPFVTDLSPASRAIRIDFDPVSQLPVGHGEVVWDGEGNEHIISYRTFTGAEIVPQEKVRTVFRQEVPDSAFQDESANILRDMQLVTGLPQIVRQTNYPLYTLPDSPDYPKLTSATLAVSDPAAPLFGLTDQVEFGAIATVGVRTQYTEQSSGATLLIIQGPAEEITAALKRSRPTWVEAEQRSLRLGQEMVPAWKLTGLDAGRVRYVVETGATVLFVDARAIEPNRVVSLIQALVPAE